MPKREGYYASKRGKGGKLVPVDKKTRRNYVKNVMRKPR